MSDPAPPLLVSAIVRIAREQMPAEWRELGEILSPYNPNTTAEEAATRFLFATRSIVTLFACTIGPRSGVIRENLSDLFWRAARLGDIAISVHVNGKQAPLAEVVHGFAAIAYDLASDTFEAGPHTYKVAAVHFRVDDRRITETGSPGAPQKSKAVYEAEFKRRIAAQEIEPTLRGEATELRKWLRLHYPTAPCPGIPSIENNIRETYNRTRRP